MGYLTTTRVLICLILIVGGHHLVLGSNLFYVGTTCYLLAQVTTRDMDGTRLFCEDIDFRLPVFHNDSHAAQVMQAIYVQHDSPIAKGPFWIDTITSDQSPEVVLWPSGELLENGLYVQVSGFCPAIGFTDSVSSRTWIVSMENCDDEFYFLCQSPDDCSNLDEQNPGFLAFQDEDVTFYMSTFPTGAWQSYVEQCERLGLQTAWFSSGSQFSRVASFISDNIGNTKYFWIQPNVNLNGDYQWDDGTTVDIAYRWDASSGPCAYMGASSDIYSLYLSDYKIGNLSCDYDTEPLRNLCMKKTIVTTSQTKEMTTMMLTNSVDFCAIPSHSPLMTYALNTSNNDSLMKTVHWSCVNEPCVHLSDEGNTSQSCLKTNGTWDGVMPSCAYSDFPSCRSVECGRSALCTYVTSGNYSTSCGTVLTLQCQSGYSAGTKNQVSQQCVGGTWQAGDQLLCSRISSYIGCKSFPADSIPLSSVYKWNNDTDSFINQESFTEIKSHVTSSLPFHCKWFCFELSKTLSILIGGDQCVCLSSASVLSDGIKVNNTYCNASCRGDSTYFCGGEDPFGFGSVYTVRPIDGCYEYKEYGGASSLQLSLNETQMTETLCSQHCALKDFEFSAVSNIFCYCLEKDDLLNLFMPVPSQMCNSPCPGLTSQRCGSQEAYFSLTDNADSYLPATCEELYGLGIRQHGTYKLRSGIGKCYMSDNTSVCEENWMGHGPFCYRFTYSTQPSYTFWDAHKSCIEDGGRLTSFDYYPSFGFLQSTIQGYTPWNITEGWWVGYYDKDFFNHIVSSSGQISKHRHLSGLSVLDSYHCSFVNTNFKSQVEKFCGNKLPGFVCEKHNTIPECVQLAIPTESKSVTTSNHTTKMSGTYCVQLCLNKRNSLEVLQEQYALVHNYTCHCVDVWFIEDTLIANPSMVPCTLNCPGQYLQTCGAEHTTEGLTAYSVYHVWPLKSTARSCNDLLFNGIDIDGNYTLTLDNNNTTITAFCNFTFHKEHCPGGFFYIEEENICAMPSIGSQNWNGVFNFCSRFEAFPLIKPPYNSSNVIVALLESIRLFDNQRIYFTGKLDPLQSNNFIWADGSLRNELLDDGLDFNSTHHLNKYILVWDRQDNVMDYDYNWKINTFVCVRELSYAAHAHLMPKAFCMNEIKLDMTSSYSKVFHDSRMTLTLCVELCKGQKSFRYALIQEAICMCASSSVFLSDEPTGTLVCGTVCPGNPYQYCGNATTGHVMVLDKERYTETAKSCLDLFNQGVRYHSTYLIANSSGRFFTECFGTDDHANPLSDGVEDWLSWENDHFSYLFVSNSSQTESMSSLQRCWSYGLGAYPVSITSQEERDFLMSVLAGDAKLRQSLEWEIGYVPSGQMRMELWSHPDLFLLHSEGNYYDFLDDCSFCPNGPSSCCLHIPSMQPPDDVHFIETYMDCSQTTPSLICKTTKNFLGCREFTFTPTLSDEEDMSALLCSEYCRGLGYLFAGVSIADCYCTDYHPSNYAAHDPADCNTPCPGHPYQYCGSTYAALWYSLERVYPSEYAYSCDDILSNEIYFNSTYRLRQLNVELLEICGKYCSPLNTNAILDTSDTAYRSNVTFHCPYGLESGHLGGWIECQRDGWSKNTNLCSYVQCPKLVVNHTTLNTSDTIFDTSVSITCVNGYHLGKGLDNFAVTCQANKEWTPEIEECSKIRCEWTAGPDLNMTSSPQVGLEFDWGTTLNLICQDGFLFGNGADTMQVSCIDYMTWRPEPVACQSFCPTIDPSVVMATMSEVNDHWEIQVMCFQGYQMPDGNVTMKSTCDGHDWSPPIINCTKKCDAIAGLVHADTKVIDAIRVNLTCLSGSQLASGHSSSLHVCQNETWTPVVKDCKPVCPHDDTWNLNATVKNVSDNVIHITCLPSLYFSSGVEERVHVCIEGLWVPGLDYCREFCDVPQVKNANVTVLDSNQVEVKCHQYHSTSSNLTNQKSYCVNGAWEPAIEDCEKESCPAIQSDTASVSLQIVDDVLVAYVTCLTSFQYFDQSLTKTFVCGVDGEWIPSFESCLPVCDPISTSNAVIERFAVNGTELSSVTCISGYIFETTSGGDSVVSRNHTCLDGDWSPKVLECHPEPCGNLTVVNALLAYTDFYGVEKVTASCETGHFFADGSEEKIFLCDHGTWTPDEENCIAECDTKDLTSIENAVITEVSSAGHPFYDIQCWQGYKFDDGTTEMTTGCGSDGLWHDPLQNCSIVQCGSLNGYTHVRLNSTLHVYNVAVTLTCDEGYVFLQNYTKVKVIQCQKDGQWVPSPENCIYDVYQQAQLLFAWQL